MRTLLASLPLLLLLLGAAWLLRDLLPVPDAPEQPVVLPITLPQGRDQSPPTLR